MQSQLNTAGTFSVMSVWLRRSRAAEFRHWVICTIANDGGHPWSDDVTGANARADDRTRTIELRPEGMQFPQTVTHSAAMTSTRHCSGADRKSAALDNRVRQARQAALIATTSGRPVQAGCNQAHTVPHLALIFLSRGVALRKSVLNRRSTRHVRPRCRQGVTPPICRKFAERQWRARSSRPRWSSPQNGPVIDERIAIHDRSTTRDGGGEASLGCCRGISHSSHTG